MARVGRLAGAILAETGGAYFLVGNPKVPCDFAAAGFEPPGDIDARVQRFIPLSSREPIELASPVLELDVEGEALATMLADVFVIERTGSVSERLWRLVIGESDDDMSVAADVVQARWVGELPPAVWRIVRDTVLRCS
jgi:hypothetical protein